MKEKEIAIASADTAQSFGIAPRVVLLSYSSRNLAAGEDVEKVRQHDQSAIFMTSSTFLSRLKIVTLVGLNLSGNKWQ